MLRLHSCHRINCRSTGFTATTARIHKCATSETDDATSTPCFSSTCYTTDVYVRLRASRHSSNTSTVPLRWAIQCWHVLTSVSHWTLAGGQTQCPIDRLKPAFIDDDFDITSNPTTAARARQQPAPTPAPTPATTHIRRTRYSRQIRTLNRLAPSSQIVLISIPTLIHDPFHSISLSICIYWRGRQA